MTAHVRPRDLGRWAAFLVLACCLALAVLQRGGVDAAEWQYLALPVSLAALTCRLLRSRRSHRASPSTTPEIWLLAAALAWMLLAMLPLPPGVVAVLSPQRADLALQLQRVTGAGAGRWLTLSVAPTATFERLLFVLPAAAVFVAAQEMPRWWTGRRVWIAVAPVIVVALLEAMLGITQFHAGAEGAGGTQTVSGTYVNRNHFAGLLEMAFPLALSWAMALWVRTRPAQTGTWTTRNEQPLGSALGAGALLVTGGAMLAGVIASVSRMGFLVTLVGLVTVTAGWLVLRRRHRHTAAWMWLLPAALSLGIVLFAASGAIILRLAGTPGSGELTTDGRFQIWAETWRLVGAYRWTGSGLGTFEHALYPFRAWMPTSAVDYAHNDYLQLLAETGVVGFLLVMAFALTVVTRTCSAAFSSSARAPWLGVGLLAAFLAAGLHALVDFNLYIPANALALAWLAGIAMSPGLADRVS